MDLQFWPGAVVMMLVAALTASLVTNGGRSAWFLGVLVLTVYVIFAMTLYMLPPRGASDRSGLATTSRGAGFSANPEDLRLAGCLAVLGGLGEKGPGPDGPGTRGATQQTP